MRTIIRIFFFIFPKNRAFVRQIGWFHYYKKRIQQLASRIFNYQLFHKIEDTNGEIIKYKIPSWDPSASGIFITEGHSDWGLEKLFLRLTSYGGVLVDVGAHSGYFPHLFYNRCEGFILIETSVKCVSECLDPLKKSWPEKNIKVINAPAFNQSGVELEISLSEDGWGMSESLNVSEHLNANNSYKTMKTVTVDEVLESQDSNIRVNAIKIDVDGPDIEILEGSSRTIEKNRPIIFIENAERRLLEIAENIKYDCFTFNADRSNPRNMCFEKLELTTDLSKIWSKMCLLVPKEQSNIVNAFVGLNRNNHDKIHLFEKF